MSYEATSSAAGGSSARTVTAFFDSRTDAEEAVSRLQREGIPRDSIRVMAGNQPSGSTGGSTGSSQEKGFWDELKELFMPDEDRHTYAEGLRRGGFLVTVHTSAAHYERALDILDDEGTIDLGQRETEWRSQGWTGMTGGAGARAGSATGMTGSAASGAASMGSSARSGMKEEVIPIAEEQLKIGKRDTSHGRVRVRSYVVETPVSEQVHLREEKVHVERRPVDRAIGGADRLFQDRTVEVEERAEEAVVSKTARVVEEVVVGKQATDRTETVSDTVRRTKVDVQDERGGAATGPGLTGTARR